MKKYEVPTLVVYGKIAGVTLNKPGQGNAYGKSLYGQDGNEGVSRWNGHA